MNRGELDRIGELEGYYFAIEDAEFMHFRLFLQQNREFSCYFAKFDEE